MKGNYLLSISVKLARKLIKFMEYIFCILFVLSLEEFTMQGISILHNATTFTVDYHAGRIIRGCVTTLCHTRPLKQHLNSVQDLYSGDGGGHHAPDTHQLAK